MFQQLVRIRTVVILLAATFAIGFFTDRHSDAVSRQQAQTRVALEHLLRLTQALSNSVTSAVLEHDVLRAASYKSLALQLTSTLNETRALTAGMSLGGEMATLIAESERLRATETRMLEQMQTGRWDDARQTLSGSEYQLKQKLYEINTDTTVGALQIELGQTQRKTEYINALMTALRVAALALLLLVGTRHARGLQREITEQVHLRQQLAQANQQLEAKVTERTAELHHALEMLAQDTAKRLAWEQDKRLEATSFLDMLLHELKNPLAVISFAAHNITSVRAWTRRMSGSAWRRSTRPCRTSTPSSSARAWSAGSSTASPSTCLRRTIWPACCAAGPTSATAPRARAWPSCRRQVLPVSVDPLIVRTVFDNLIDNALAYSPAGSRVEVQLDSHEEAALRQLRFRVRNHPGAAGAPDPDKVFSKYYRAAGAQALSGAGLGLFLVRSLAQLCGGDVTYQRDGQQIVFEATMPC